MNGTIISDGICMGHLLVLDPSHNMKLDNRYMGPTIVATLDLEPNDFIKLDKSCIVGFITKNGTPNSHASILIRNMNIPAITNISIQKEWNGKFAIVDAYQGCVILEPTQEIIQLYNKKKFLAEKNEKLLLNKFLGRNAETKSGKRIHVYANITGLSDMQNVINYDAEGIGVFKSEFLYLESPQLPTEDEQFTIYKNIATAMDKKKVIIRTMDIGADKNADCFNLDKECNPAMGYRAIRICLDHPEIFKSQIKAILRASAFGNISIMYPMIVSVEEILQIYKIMDQAKNELRSAGIPHNENIEQGIMIETPAAVMISKELAEVVDFFSIGTNDLLQYMFAADRQNPKLLGLVDPYHPAVIRSIKHIIQCAHTAGIWVGVSGELASDIGYIGMLVDYGIDALAVSPTSVLKVRKTICEIE